MAFCRGLLLHVVKYNHGMAWRGLRGFLAVGVFGVALGCQAEDVPRLRLNGFGTVGVVHVQAPQGWGFRRSHDQPRVDEALRADVDSRLGVQANYELTPQLEAVGQLLLARQLQPQPLQLAFLAWRPEPGLTVRLGRTNNGIYQYSDSRNIGFSYPWARPNNETNASLPLYTLDGIDATWQWQQAESFWSLHTYLGRSRSTLPSATGGRVTYDVQRLAGATLKHTRGGLELRGTLAVARAQIQTDERTLQAVATLDQLGRLPGLANTPTGADLRDLHDTAVEALKKGNVTYLSLGAIYDDGGPWVAAMEAIGSTSGRSYGDVRLGFASLGHRFGAVTPFVAVGTGRFTGRFASRADWGPDLMSALGPQMAGMTMLLMSQMDRNLKGATMDQHSLSLGLRWDLHPRAALKLQHDRYWVARRGSLTWTDAEPRAARPGVTSLSVDFVF